MELSYLIQALLKRKWIILASSAIAVLLAALFVILKGKVYESSAQYSTGFTIQQVSLVNEAFNPYEADTKFNNVLEAFNSQKVIGMLSYDLLLHDIQNPSKPYKTLSEGQKKSPHYLDVNLDRARQILVAKIDSSELLSTVNPEERDLLELLYLYGYDYNAIEKNLIIDRIPRTDYLSIVYRSRNPYLSAYVVNRIGAIFLKFYTSLSSTLTSESVEKISNIVDQKKRQVDSITENLRRERVSQGGMDPEEYSKSSIQTVSQLQAKLADEKAGYNKSFYQLQSINNQLNGLGTASKGGSVTGNNEDIVRIRTRLRELAPNKDDPKVAAQIRTLQDELKTKESTVNSGQVDVSPDLQRRDLLSQKSDLEEQLKASEQTIGYLNSQINKYSNVDAGSSAKINVLKNEMEIAAKEYSDIKSKFVQAEGYKETSSINFRQTLIGQPAVEPQPSHLILIAGIGGFSMFSLSSLIIILLELLDSSLKTPSGFIHTVGLALLGSMGRVNLKDKNVPDLLAGAGSTGGKEESAFLQFIRKLRFDIERSGKKVVLVTSTKKGAGKSTIIEALAVSMSMIDKKVLIIDTNFSNNSLTRHFNVNGGLEDFSLPEAAGNDLRLFRHIINPTNVRLVDIIGCKGGNYTPDEILGKSNLLLHMKTLTTNYDYILLEGAALNDHADAKELSRYVEGIVAVFAADSVITQVDQESVQFLSGFGDKFIGSVLNKVEKENIEF
jgi:polysaccharide biosynthesis transport protein